MMESVILKEVQAVVVRDDPSVLISRSATEILTHLVGESIGVSQNGTSITLFEFEQVIIINGEQTIQLPYNISQFRLMTINGLAQSGTAFSITGNQLVLPADLLLMVGDMIKLVYIR